MTRRKLILASGSETRLRVLRQAGIDPEVSVSGVDETTDDVTTDIAVSILAERKAASVDGSPGSLVLGCDSLLDLDGTTIGKPTSSLEAAEIWSRLSGRTGTLFTGHCLIDDSNKRVREVAATSVHFGTPTAQEVEAYVASGEPMSLAGAFSIDGLGAPFISGIDGDPSNVLGLSMPLLRKMLLEFGVSIPDLWRRPISPTLRRATSRDRQRIAELIDSLWGLPVVSVSGLYNPATLPAILAEQDGELLGVLTYRVNDYEMEVVTLNSLVEDRGVGSVLLAEARRTAREAGRRLWLITTNENLRAIAFYQRRGMEMAALHRNFGDEVLHEKPDLRLGGGGLQDHGIAFRHAIEFEYPLSG